MDTTVCATFASDQQAAGKRVIQASVRSGFGEVSPEGAVLVNEGADSAFHFQPASGYRVAALVLDGEEVPYTAESYTFEDVREDHALEVVFASATSPGGPDPVGKLAQRVATGDAPWLLVCAVVAVVAAGVALAAHRRSRKRNSRGW